MKLSEHRVALRTPDVLRISGPGDFSLAPWRLVESTRIFDADVSPYCFDLANRMLLCVSTPDISTAVFFYQAQRSRARSVIAVPFDALPRGPASPVLIFSIGRCGSTLLAKALESAGVRTVSEPDFYRQAACSKPPDPSLQGAINGATGLLPYPVIKLHLECNNAPLLIAGSFIAPRIMFILRDPVDWAASLRRVSRNALEPAWAVSLLQTGLSALDELTRSYAVRIAYYEDFRELGAEYVTDLLSWMGRPETVSRETLLKVAARDAQEGTVASRDAVSAVPDDPRFRDAFRQAWLRQRPAELIERLQLRLV
jgi:hypothetical protein